MPLSAAIRAEISAVVGDRQVITEPEQLRVYNCDGLTGWRAMPELVCLPGSTAEVQGVVRIQKQHDIGAGLPESAIDRFLIAPVGLEDRHDPATITGNHACRIVGGTVIQDDDFIRRPRLTQRALDRAADIFFIIVAGYHDGNAKRHDSTMRRAMPGARTTGATFAASWRFMPHTQTRIIGTRKQGFNSDPSPSWKIDK